jgi:hypothetical protein
VCSGSGTQKLSALTLHVTCTVYPHSRACFHYFFAFCTDVSVLLVFLGGQNSFFTTPLTCCLYPSFLCPSVFVKLNISLLETHILALFFFRFYMLLAASSCGLCGLERCDRTLTAFIVRPPDFILMKKLSPGM